MTLWSEKSVLSSQRFEHQRPLAQQAVEHRVRRRRWHARRRVGDLGQEPGVGANQRDRIAARHQNLRPDAGVGAVVHGVVDEPRVPAHRDAAPRGAEIGLGGDGVLGVGKPVADVGQHLDQGDAQVGSVALAPLRQRLGHPVEHQPAEAAVVLGEVADLRRLFDGLGADIARARSRNRSGIPP